MFNVVLDKPLDFIALGVAVLIVVVPVMLLVKFFTSGGGFFRAGSVEVGGNGKKKPKPCHATCPHVGDVMQVIANTTALAEERNQIKFDVVENQMKYFEELELEMRGEYQRVFINLLDELCPGIEVAQHPEYLSYVATLGVVGRELRDWYRTVMRQNHLALMTPQEWLDYKARKCLVVTQRGTDLLNQYWRGKTVTRAALYKRNNSDVVKSRLEEAVNGAFEAARQESVNAEKKIAEASAQYERWLRDHITG